MRSGRAHRPPPQPRSPAASQVGFSNKACSTAGPVLRTPSSTADYRTWTVKAAGPKYSQLGSFFPRSKTQPACKGNVVANKASTCKDPCVTMRTSKTTGYDAPLQFLRVSGVADTFYIRVGDRASGCFAYLSASSTCSNVTLSVKALAASGSSARSLQMFVIKKSVSAGAPGSPGSPGSPGNNGSPGTNGNDGNDGNDGVDGSNGPSGSPGPKGSPGVSGSPGSNGSPGS